MAMDAPLPDPLPHILLVSLPAPGHLFPFTSFAYQLAEAGAQVTLLTTGVAGVRVRDGAEGIAQVQAGTEGAGEVHARIKRLRTKLPQYKKLHTEVNTFS